MTKKNYSKTLLILLLLVSPSLLKAQSSSKVFFGGNLGIMVTDYLDINIAPIVGYQLTPHFAVGALAKYEYSYNRDDINPVRANTYGGGLFTRYDVSSLFTNQALPYNIFVQGEYQHLYTTAENTNSGYKDSWNEDRLYLGAGISISSGGRGSFYTYIAFDVISLFNEKNSSVPVVSAGYMF